MISGPWGEASCSVLFMPDCCRRTLCKHVHRPCWFRLEGLGVQGVGDSGIWVWGFGVSTRNANVGT